MSFFHRRPAISKSEALAQLGRIIREHVNRSDFSEVAATVGIDECTLKSQLAKLALFAVYFALRFSRVRDWRERAKELFMDVSQETSRQFKFEVLGFETEFQVYGLSINISGGDPGRVKSEIGKGFCQILGKNPSDNVDVAVIGHETFTAVGDSVVTMQKEFALR